jgi:hypothetical protein
MFISFYVLMIVLASVITPRGDRLLSGAWFLCLRRFLTAELLSRLMVTHRLSSLIDGVVDIR